MEKSHCFFVEGTHAQLTSGSAYKNASSLHHSIEPQVLRSDVTVSEVNKALQWRGKGGVYGRETPSGGNFGGF